jgi:hypothetical protein
MEREVKGNEQDRSYQSPGAGAAPIRMVRQGKGWLGLPSLAEELVSMVVGAVGPHATSPAIFTWMGFNTGWYVVGGLEFLSAVVDNLAVSAVERRSEARQRVALMFGISLVAATGRVVIYNPILVCLLARDLSPSKRGPMLSWQGLS